MTAIDMETSVGRLVVEQPNLSRVFDKLGINYCCSGKLSLREACDVNGLDAASVVRELHAAIEGQHADSGSQPDWTQASPGELCDHIEQTYHHYLADELPRLTTMVDKVAHVHGQRLPSLYEVQSIFTNVRDELITHTNKERDTAYPLIRSLEAAGEGDGNGAADANGATDGDSRTLSAIIEGLEREHVAVDARFRGLREATNDYIPPHDACRTHRAVLAGLEQLERETYDHIHKENNILFPRAVAREQ